MLKGYLYTYSAIVIFSTLEVFSKLTIVSMSPFTLWFFRMVFGTMVLFPFIKFKSLKNLTKVDWLNIAWLGSVTVGIGVSFFYIGLYHTSAAGVAIISSSIPLFVLLFSKLIYKEKFSFRVYIGMALGFLSVVIVSYKPAHLFSSLHFLYVLVSAILFALYTVLGRKISQKTSSATLNALSFIFGMITVLIILLVTSQPIAIPRKDFLYVLYLGVIVTGVAYMLYFQGVKVVGASLSSMAFFVKPWLASLLAFTILGEKFTFSKDFGGVLMAISLIIAYWPKKVHP
jgi:drug/metabolite transporter (DMT)-like permease